MKAPVDRWPLAMSPGLRLAPRASPRRSLVSSATSTVDEGGVAALRRPALVTAGAAGALAEAFGHAVAEHREGVPVPLLNQLRTGGTFRLPAQHRQHGQLPRDVRMLAPAARNHLRRPPGVLVVDPDGHVVTPAPHGCTEL